MVKTLILPPHYDAANAFSTTYRPVIAAPTNDPARVTLPKLASDWRRDQGFKVAGADHKKIVLLLIDMQYDFGFGDGTLFVGGRSGQGAMEDAKRVAEFVYRNLHLIHEVRPTLDSHVPYQVFYPKAHERSDGTNPNPFEIIRADQYKSGEFMASKAMAAFLGVPVTWLTKYFTYYCEQLESTRRFELNIWPEHCLVGSHGHQLAGIIDEAVRFHAYARGAFNTPEVKGGSPFTECYSVLGPEVHQFHNGQPIKGAEKNVEFIKTLVDADAVIIAGEAMSHCLAWTVRDLLDAMGDPTLISKVYLLEDGTSPVVVPGIVDHTDAALAAFAEFRNRGAHVVSTTDPMESWPGVMPELVAALSA